MQSLFKNFTENKKAISATIASVLLITFTVSLGILFYGFSKDYVVDLGKEAESSVTEHGYSLTECSRSNLLLVNAKSYQPQYYHVFDDFANTSYLDYYENVSFDFAASQVSLQITYEVYPGNITLYVYNPNSFDLSNYQVRFVFNSSLLIENYSASVDCSDIRIVDKNNNLLNFWVWKESCNTSSTEIYFKAPYLPANYNETFYLLFGDGSNYSWGSYGDVFENSYANDKVRFYPLDSGYYMSCILTQNGSVLCGGGGLYALVYSTGYMTPWNDIYYTNISDLNVVDMSLDYGIAFFVLDNGSVVFQGNNDIKYINNNHILWSLSQYVQGGDQGTTILENVTHVSSAYSSACFLLNNGSVMCAGSNFRGTLGDGTTVDSATPVFVKGGQQGTNILENVTQVSLGYGHSCALLNNGSVMCWGNNYNGQLGDGTTTNRYTPVFVKGGDQGTTILENVTQIDLGTYHSCALTSDGAIYCWGYNAYGQLGDGTTTSNSLPQKVSSTVKFVEVKASGYYHHTCAVSDTAEVYCWGYNANGQLGDGTTTNRYTPVKVLGGQQGTTYLSNIIEITLGYMHSCALLSNGSVMCWGDNGAGQLGDGTTTDRYTPVFVKSVSALENITFIGAGDSHTCALLNNGSVMCWGYNAYGQLGDGTTATRYTPVFVKSNATEIFTLNLTLSKTNPQSAYDARKDYYFYLTERSKINEMETSLFNITPPKNISVYVEQGLLQTKNLLAFNSSRIDYLISLVIGVVSYGEYVDAYISNDNVSYTSIGLSHDFTDLQQIWDELYLRIYLHTNPERSLTPLLENYDLTYQTLPDNVMRVVLYNPSPLNLTLVSLYIEDISKEDSYCLVPLSNAYIDSSSNLAIDIPKSSCQNFVCDGNTHAKLKVGTECMSFEFDVVC